MTLEPNDVVGGAAVANAIARFSELPEPGDQGLLVREHVGEARRGCGALHDPQQFGGGCKLQGH